MIHWLERLKHNEPRELSVHVNLIFFNTYTSKTLLNIFQKAVEFEKLGTNVKIYWYYEDGDSEILESGTHYESILDKEFIYVCTMPRGLVSA